MHPKTPRKRNFLEERRWEQQEKERREQEQIRTLQELVTQLGSYNVPGGARIEFKEKCLPIPKPKTKIKDRGFVVHEKFLQETVNSYDVCGECPHCGERTLRPSVEIQKRNTIIPSHIVFTCSSCKFKRADEPELHEKLGLPKECLADVFLCLAGEIRFDQLRSLMRNKGLDDFGRNTYYDIFWILYAEQSELFEDIMVNNRKKVLKFYKDRFNITPDSEGKIDITVSADGCYTKRSYQSIYNSRFCVTFIIECYTGIVIDLQVVERCRDPDHKDRTAEYCEDGKFHGSAGLLEISAAKTLYRRSAAPDWPFRYMVHVGDGDSAVAVHVCNSSIYEGRQISKEECIYHARKSVKKAIYKLIKNLHKCVPKQDGSGFMSKPVFTKDVANKYCVRFANLWLFVLQKAVKVTKNGRTPRDIAYMSRCLKAIGRHYCDHKDASFDDRVNKFHLLCTQEFCKFKQLPLEEQRRYQCKDHEFYVKEEDQAGNTITEIMDAIIQKFDDLANEEKMARCTRLLNQNINESLHNRTFGIIRKEKNFGYWHINFAANLAAHIQNDGHETTIGTWMEFFDLYTPEMQESLRYKDDERRRNAADHHQNIKKKSRYQGKAIKEIELDGVFYESGRHFEDYTPDEVQTFDIMTDLNLGVAEENDEELADVDLLEDQNEGSDEEIVEDQA